MTMAFYDAVWYTGSNYSGEGAVFLQVTFSQKERNHQPFVEGRFAAACRDLLHPALMAMARWSLKFRIICDREYKSLPNRPILFAPNHYCGMDITVVCNAIHGRAVIVAGKQSLFPVDEFFLRANGVIFVDRLNREDTAACKRAVTAQLRAGRNVILFPEGTSNVSDALPMYPMKWGIIDVAQQTGAQIIPMILRYDKAVSECHVRFASPMTVENMTKAEGIEALRDTMATLRWESFEAKGIHSRRELNTAEERRQNIELLLSYRLLDYETEKQVVFRPAPTEAEVFEPIIRAYSKMMGGK